MSTNAQLLTETAKLIAEHPPHSLDWAITCQSERRRSYLGPSGWIKTLTDANRYSYQEAIDLLRIKSDHNLRLTPFPL